MKKVHTASPAESAGPRTATWSGGWATIRDLEVFKAVIEAGTATLAAAQLGISQPAVSRTLSQLEERSGRSLFVRSGPSLSPTAQGLALYEEIRLIFQGLERIRAFEWGRAAAHQALRIAATPTMAQCWLNAATARFQARHDGCQITLEIVPTPQILELVADQQVDIGIASVPAPGSNLRKIPFRRSRYVCAMPPSHALAQLSSVRPGDLQDIPLIAMNRRNEARATTDRIFTKAGVRPYVVIETSTAASALDHVAAGAGVALVNAFPVVLLQQPDVVFRLFEPALSYDTSFFVASDEVPGSLEQSFMEHVRSLMPPADEFSEAV